MPLCLAVHPKPVPTGSASDLFMQMAITNEAHTLDAPRGAKTGVGKRSGMGCFWGDNGWGDILTAQWKRLIWFPAQIPNSNAVQAFRKRVPEVGLGNSVAWGAVMEGDLTGRQCMSQSRNMAAHQWLPGGDYCTVGRPHYWNMLLTFVMQRQHSC